MLRHHPLLSCACYISLPEKTENAPQPVQSCTKRIVSSQCWCIACRPQPASNRALFVNDSTLLLDGGELAYLKYFFTLLLSPVPEYQAKSSWLGIESAQVI